MAENGPSSRPSSPSTNPTSGQASEELSILHKISFKIVDSLETFFYKWGHFLGSRPVIPIVSCFIITIICGLGLFRFTDEKRPDKLWIPWNSEFVKDTEWLNRNFPSPFRFHYAIVTADNVLDPKVFNVLLDIHNKVSNLKSLHHTWKDLCFRLPVIKVDNTIPRRKREITENYTSTTPTYFDNFSFEDDFASFEDASESEEASTTEKPFDPSVTLPVQLYCSIVSSLDQECFEINVLELWSYNDTKVKSLSKGEILEVLNNPQISPVFGRPVDYTTDLGRVTRNESGYIVGAQAIMLRWFTALNRTAMDMGEVVTDEGTGQAVDPYNFAWEKELANFFQNYHSPEGVDIYFNVARSFADISGSTIWADAYKLAAGFSIVFMYVIFMLGKFSFVEQRPFLSLAGLACVGLAIVCSYGISSAFKMIYSPVHNILPFLLMGLGIDDMFVIMQCWNNLSKEEMKKSIPERLALTLQKAGVSITVTSLTDFFAFAIGATTVLPALQSFCVYAALGIIFTYIFQATFFAAWLSIDQRRIEQRRNAFCPFIIHRSVYPAKNLPTKSFAQNIIEKYYCKVLFNNISKALVYILTLGILCVNIWGNVLLRQEFNPIWFLPQDSYLFQYFAARDTYFSEKGEEGFLFMNEVDLKSNLPSIDRLIVDLNNTGYINELDSWYPPFKQYVNSNFGKDVPKYQMSDKEFRRYLGKFLYSPTGGKYQSRFKFNGNLTCGRLTPKINLSSMNFKFKTFSGPEHHIPAMNRIKGAIRNANFTPHTSHAFVWSFAFAGWETDEIITVELYRNMGLAMLCIFITTLVLIANFKTCLLVFLCVVLTLVDVAGSMHFWNLTIDTVSCIDLVLAIGLCVDYAAHIGHAFMTCVGTRGERAKEALVKIGPAVLNGGFSTFLAFVLLANSKSHVFTTFFKIFLLVVVYGLYHGLVLLPLLLSLVGPNPYSNLLTSMENSQKEVQMQLINRPRSPKTFSSSLPEKIPEEDETNMEE